MKKFYSILTALTCILSLHGAPLTPEQALARASGATTKARAISADIATATLAMTGTDSAGVAAYYVFTNKTGTLFLSADDIATPVLGYTHSGNFAPDKMPPQLRWWLGEYARQIAWQRDNIGTGVLPQKAPAAANVNRPPIAPMLTTIWNQDAPYNNFCPIKDGERTVTGCVATAMAQVMNYFQWPQKQIPAISYEWNGQILTSPATTIEWSLMRKDYYGSYTTAEADAVARLMQVAGYSVQMGYGTIEDGGSGAQSYAVRGAFVDSFGYDIASDYRMRNFCTDAEWEEALYNNLAQIGPVYYDGASHEAGHAFVCDGYDTAGYYHFNWGWGGYQDGYFQLSALNPGDVGIGGGNSGYNFDQGMLIGAGRPKAASTAPEPFIGCNASLTGSAEDSVLFVETDSEYGGFWNFGYSTTTYTFGLKLQNNESDEITYLSGFESTLEPNYGYSYLPFNLDSAIPDGDYKASPIYRIGEGPWKDVKFYTGMKNYLDILYIDGAVYLNNEHGKITLVDMDSPTGFQVGKPYFFTVSAQNSYSRDLPYTATANLVTFDANDDPYTVAVLGSASAIIPAGGEALLEFGGTTPQVDPGEYFLVLTANSDTPQAVFDIEITAEASIHLQSTAPTSRYYNLQGQALDSAPTLPGAYIRRTDTKTSKIIVR